MDKRLSDCLQGKHGSYILPFLWLHGEPKERVREEILAIKNSGINEFCAESRPYENFCKDEWWDFMADIMETNPDNSPVCRKINEVFHLE
jgi:hypothetical protein